MPGMMDAITGLIWTKKIFQERKDKSNIKSGLVKKVDMGDTFQAVHDVIEDVKKGKKGLADVYEALITLKGAQDEYHTELVKTKADDKFIKSFEGQQSTAKDRLGDVGRIVKVATSYSATLNGIKQSIQDQRLWAQLADVSVEANPTKRANLAKAGLAMISHFTKSNAKAIPELLEDLRTAENLKNPAFDPKKTGKLWAKMTIEELFDILAKMVHGSNEQKEFTKSLTALIKARPFFKDNKDLPTYKTAEIFSQEIMLMAIYDAEAQNISRSFQGFFDMLKNSGKVGFAEADFTNMDKEIKKAEAIGTKVAKEVPKLAKLGKLA